MKTLAHYRDDIDKIDEKILELLKTRSLLIPEIKELKKNRQQKIAFDRELEIYNKILQTDTGLYNNLAIQQIWREIIGATLAIEQSCNIAILSNNPKINFMLYQVAQNHFGVSANIIAYKSKVLLKSHLVKKTVNCAIVNNDYDNRKTLLNDQIKILQTLPLPNTTNKAANYIIIGLKN